MTHTHLTNAERHTQLKYCISVFSRSPYFRRFRGWPSVRENNMTAKFANSSSETNHQYTHGGLQGQRFISIGDMHTILALLQRFTRQGLTKKQIDAKALWSNLDSCYETYSIMNIEYRGATSSFHDPLPILTT